MTSIKCHTRSYLERIPEISILEISKFDGFFNEKYIFKILQTEVKTDSMGSFWKSLASRNPRYSYLIFSVGSTSDLPSLKNVFSVVKNG